MADIAIFRINYKSDFILTLESDAGWMTPFCIKFWTGAPSKAYYAYYDGMSYTHCAPVEDDPTKLLVQFDDHHLPIGDLKFQIGYHFTVADFPTSVEDEVINQAAVIINNDGEPQQVMLDFNGETAPEIEFALPAYANEAQRIANEQTRIAAEEQRISNEEARITAEQRRISNEEARVREFARLKTESETATAAANEAATLANEKAHLAGDKAALAQAAAALANAKAQLAADKAALAQSAATLANDKAQLAADKAALAQQKADYAQTQGNYAKTQGDAAKTEAETAHALNEEVRDDEAARDQAEQTRQQQEAARQQAETARGTAYEQAEAGRNTSFQQAESARTTAFNNQLQQQQTSYTSAEAARETAFNEAEQQRDAEVDEKVADITNLQAQIGYFVCDTAAATAAKTITATGYALTTGGNIRIKMTNANTADAVTLNINNTGAKALFYNGTQASSTNSWEAGEVVEVYYDGTQFMASNSQGGGNLSIIHKIDTTTKYTDKDVAGADGVKDMLYAKVIDKEKITTTETYTFTQGKLVKLSDGALSNSGSSWLATEDYIPIDNWESIYTTATGASSAASVAFYDSEKNFLSGSPCGTTTTVQVPDNAAFARFTLAGGTHVITTFHYEGRIDLLEESQTLVEQLKTDGETYTGSDLVNGVYTGDRQSTISLASNVSWSKRGKFSIKYGDWFFLHSSPYDSVYFTFFIIDEENIILEEGAYPKDFPVKVSHPTAAYICVNQSSRSIDTFKLVIKKGGIANDFAQSQAVDYKVIGAEDTSEFQAGSNWYNIDGVISLRRMSICSSIRSIPVKENTLFYLDSTGNNGNGYTYHITDIDGNILKSGGAYQKGFVITPINSARLYINCLTGYLSSFELYIFKQELANFASKILSNKKICFMGDSITTDLYVGLPLQRTLGMELLHTTYGGWGNLAQGNATYADQENTEPFGSDTNNYNRTISNQVYKLLQHTTTEGEQIAWHIASDNSDHSIDTSIATGTGFTDDIPDIIYIAMGTNDSASTLGDVDTIMAQNYSALDRLTLASAMRWAIETLQNVYPQARICIATAIWRGTKNIEPHNEVIREVAKRMAVPIIDSFYESGFTKYTFSLYSSDSIHPNRNGAQDMIAEYLAGKIKSLANW